MTWNDITKTDEFQSLSPKGKQEYKSQYFERNILPKIEQDEDLKAAGVQTVYEEFMRKPDDSGQTYFTSALSSIGRGAASVVPGVVGGLGYLTTSETLIEAGESIEQGIAGVLPINPKFEQTFGIKAFSAAGQAVSMLGTGIVGGLARGAAGARGAMLSQGFFMGAEGGGESARQLGLEGGEAWQRAFTGGAIEVVSETVPFGMMSELKALGKIANVAGTETIESGGRVFLKAVGTETVEEGIARTLNNLTDIAMAPHRAGGVTEGVLEDAALGGVGGAVFGGFGAAVNRGRRRQQQDAIPPRVPATPGVAATPSAATEGQQTTQAPAPVRAIRLRDTDGTIYLRDVDGSWMETGLVPEEPGGPVTRPLNPMDLMDSATITRLSTEAARLERLESAGDDATGRPAAPAAPADQAPVVPAASSAPPAQVAETPEIANAKKELLAAQAYYEQEAAKLAAFQPYDANALQRLAAAEKTLRRLGVDPDAVRRAAQRSQTAPQQAPAPQQPAPGTQAVRSAPTTNAGAVMATGQEALEKAFRQRMRDRLAAGEIVVFSRPDSIAAARANPFYITKDLPDGSVQIVGVQPETNNQQERTGVLEAPTPEAIESGALDNEPDTMTAEEIEAAITRAEGAELAANEGVQLEGQPYEVDAETPGTGVREPAAAAEVAGAVDVAEGRAVAPVQQADVEATNVPTAAGDVTTMDAVEAALNRRGLSSKVKRKTKKFEPVVVRETVTESGEITVPAVPSVATDRTIVFMRGDGTEAAINLGSLRGRAGLVEGSGGNTSLAGGLTTQIPEGVQQVVVIDRNPSRGSLAGPTFVKVFKRSESSPAALQNPQGFRNLVVARNLEAGFMTDAGIKALVDLASSALRAGRSFAQWASDAIKRFGNAIKRYLKGAWQAATARLPNDRGSIGGDPLTDSRTRNPETVRSRASAATTVRMGRAAQPQQADATNPLRGRYVKLNKLTQALEEGMRETKATRDNRTSNGQPVPEMAYDTLSDQRAMDLSMSVLDELAHQQVGKDEMLALLRDGEAPGIDLKLRAREQTILGVQMVKAGRYSEFGILRSEVMPVLEELAGQFGMIGHQWQQLLDPIEKAVQGAVESTKKDFKATTGQDADKVAAELDNDLKKAEEQAAMSPEARKALDEVKRKLRQRLAPEDVRQRMGMLFGPNNQALADKLYKEGADAIAASFFRGNVRKPKRGPLGQGAQYVQGELSSLLNEALDALGIQRVQEAKDPEAEFKRIVQELGLNDMRAGKMLVIDDLVRKRIEEYAENGATEFANDLLEQWEFASSMMTGRAASGATLRRAANQVLKEQDKSIRDLAGLADPSGAIDGVVASVMERVRKAGDPEAGGAPDLAALEAELRATVTGMVAEKKARMAARAAEQARLRNSPEEVTRRAERILDSIAQQLSDTPMSEQVKKDLDPVRALVSEALKEDEPMMRFRELVMQLGVAGDVAASLELAILEARRRAEFVDEINRMQRVAEARKKAIERVVDSLTGKSKRATPEKMSKFLRNLVKADQLGILDKDFFLDAFANAFELSFLTPAIAKDLRETWVKLNEKDENGRDKLFGSEREMVGMRFQEMMNAVAPGVRWDNLMYSQFMAAALSTIGSMLNQFSGVFRKGFGVDAFARTFARGDVRNAAREWWTQASDLITNLPAVVSGLKGEALGLMPPVLKANFEPREQSVQHTKAGQTLRIRTPRGSTITASEPLRKFLRLRELMSWRPIRGAEALSGTIDYYSRARDVLTEFHKQQGLAPAEASAKARLDLLSTPQARKAAEERALQEQRDGNIGATKQAVRKRVEELIIRGIEEQTGADLMRRIEHLTAHAQFKTPPTGWLGHTIYSLFQQMTGNQDNPGSRVARFFFLFGRFLGHTVDAMLGYSPLWFTTLGRSNSKSKRTKAIVEIFGSVENYNRNQHGKAAASVAFLAANGLLMALAESLAGDDDEPFFQVFGSAPSANRDSREALAATGRWQPNTMRLFGANFNYTQIPELAGLFTLLGNISDYAKFGEQLYSKNGEVVPVNDAAFFGVMDVLQAPIKRSTYRQWFDAMTKAMDGRKSDAINNLLTAPIGTALRLPVVVDIDKLMREADGARDPEGLAENILRRIPFVHVGERMMNAYGEDLPGLGVITMFPASQDSPPDVLRAATINVETNTVRGMPRLPEEINGQEVTAGQLEEYVRLSGKYYVESLLRNEQAIRRAFATGGREAAKKPVSNISAKANERARQELGLKELK